MLRGTGPTINHQCDYVINLSGCDSVPGSAGVTHDEVPQVLINSDVWHPVVWKLTGLSLIVLYLSLVTWLWSSCWIMVYNQFTINRCWQKRMLHQQNKMFHSCAASGDKPTPDPKPSKPAAPLVPPKKPVPLPGKGRPGSLPPKRPDKPLAPSPGLK